MAYWLWSISPDVYPAALRAETLALRQQGRARLAEVRPGDTVFVYLSGSQTIAGQFEAVGAPFEDATALAPGRHLPHRLRVRPVAVLPEELYVPREAFAPTLRVLDDYPEVAPELRFRRVVQRVVHRLDTVDGRVLEFLLRARLGADPDALMAAVEAVRDARVSAPAAPDRPAAVSVAEPAPGYAAFDRPAALEGCLEAVAARGFAYEPWQVAAYVTAVRTKPLVLLAGVTGVGKSRLPVLVEAATGGDSTVVPVRPDWTDPAETLGYTDLGGRFRPGAVLRAAREAADRPERHHTLVLDEMNLARPEHYLAEVLSRIEQREATPEGVESPPLLVEALAPADAVWQAVRLGPSLGVVGTVNVDESTHPFSRKVLDRAFVLEIEPGPLGAWPEGGEGGAPRSARWPVEAWAPRAVRLGELPPLDAAASAALGRALGAVVEADAVLAPAGLGLGYRARDEVALFVLHARDTPDAFRTRAGEPVDPLDLALAMKVLPRIDGARAATRAAVSALLVWASGGAPDARDAVEAWIDLDRPSSLQGARFPRSAARLARILEGADEDGVASFWA